MFPAYALGCSSEGLTASTSRSKPQDCLKIVCWELLHTAPQQQARWSSGPGSPQSPYCLLCSQKSNGPHNPTSHVPPSSRSPPLVPRGASNTGDRLASPWLDAIYSKPISNSPLKSVVKAKWFAVRQFCSWGREKLGITPENWMPQRRGNPMPRTSCPLSALCSVVRNEGGESPIVCWWSEHSLHESARKTHATTN